MLKSQVSHRLRDVRRELYGEHGGPQLARLLKLPARTWYNYETGVTVPAEVLLSFLEQTSVNPSWLYHGEGPRYRHESQSAVLESFTPEQLIRRGLEKLESEPAPIRFVIPEDHPFEENPSEAFLPVKQVALADLVNEASVPTEPLGHIMFFRHWIAHPNQTVAIQLQDDVMYPVLPQGSLVAIDLSQRDLNQLDNQLVAIQVEEHAEPWVRRLSLNDQVLLLHGGRHDNAQLKVIQRARLRKDQVLGRVICSWSQFDEASTDPLMSEKNGQLHN